MRICEAHIQCQSESLRPEYVRHTFTCSWPFPTCDISLSTVLPFRFLLLFGFIVNCSIANGLFHNQLDSTHRDIHTHSASTIRRVRRTLKHHVFVSVFSRFTAVRVKSRCDDWCFRIYQFRRNNKKKRKKFFSLNTLETAIREWNSLFFVFSRDSASANNSQ